jgi:ACS family tartrate transporter-like MFS transporter
MTHAVSEPQPAGTADRATLAKVARRLVPFMFVLYIANFLDRVNVSFAALGMNHDIGLSNTAYGFGAGIFFFGYVLFQVPANLIMVRMGARRWIGGIVIVWGVVAGLMALIQTPTHFYVLRVLLGFAEAGFFPGMILYLTYWFPVAERARAVAGFMLAIPVSGIIGGPLAGALLEMHGIAGVAGWRWLYLLEAVPSFAASRCDVSAAGTVKSGTVWAIASVWILAILPGYGVSLWMPQLIREQAQLTDFTTGLLCAIPHIAGCIAMLAIGASSDRTGERFYHVALPILGSAVGLAMAAVSGSVIVTVVGLSLAVAGVNGCYGAFWSLPSRFLHGASAAAGIGLINAIGNVGGFVGPYLLGALKDRTQSFSGTLFALALMAVCSAVIALLLKRAPLLADHRH